MVQAVKGNDLPLIQGIALIFCVLMLAITVIIDVLYAVLNPRMRKPMSAIELPAAPHSGVDRSSSLCGALRELALAQPRVWVGGTILLVAMLLAVFSRPGFAPHDPLDQDLLHMLAPPAWAPDGSASYPLGTDGPRGDACCRARNLWRAGGADGSRIAAAWGSMLLGSTLALARRLFRRSGGSSHQLCRRPLDVVPPGRAVADPAWSGSGPVLTRSFSRVVLVDWTRFCPRGARRTCW